MKQQDIFSKVDAYISDLLAPEDTILTKVIENMADQGLPLHQVSANQGKLLQVFMKTCHAMKVLELGTLGAYSTIWLARALPENGKLITIEADQQHYLVALQNIENAGLSEKIEVRLGKALDILPLLVSENEGPFDLIFIDADKPPYSTYFDYAVQLSRSGTIIICDNVIREGKVLDSNSTDEKVQGVQRFNQMLSRYPEITATIIQTVGGKEHDGMAIAVVH